jgi:chromatin remodeling complex protein RSC6
MNKLILFFFFAVLHIASNAQTTNDKRIVALEPQLNKLLKTGKQRALLLQLLIKTRLFMPKVLGLEI